MRFFDSVEAVPLRCPAIYDTAGKMHEDHRESKENASRLSKVHAATPPIQARPFRSAYLTDLSIPNLARAEQNGILVYTASSVGSFLVYSVLS